ncbi:MAG: HAMP domain-containing histidine kinase [Proteobacteria bacterium]|nr:HAMP domain-containing histidine kinase [Pseudomonadota bacterium]
MARIQYRRRLRSRIVISFVLFGFALTALFALSAVYLRGYLEDKLIGEALIKNVDDYAAKFHEDPSNEFLAFQKIVGYVYSERKFANVPFAWRDLSSGVHDLTEPDGHGGKLVYKLAVRKDPGYWFFLKYDTTQERHSQRVLEGALVLAVLGFSVLALVLGFWLSRRVMSPVTELARRVQAMGGSGKAEPLAPHFANDEVGALAAAFDEYARKLTALVERDREFNADVSHELRTPLAVIATTTELLLNAENLTAKVRERLKRIERASRQSTELTNALLLLSRSERSAPVDGETTDVAQVVEQVIDVYRAHLGKKPVAVRMEVESAVEVVAPSSVVAVALGNLIGNAFKYTQSGEVVVTVGAGGGKLTVEDTGPGIKPEDAERLFERGVRGEGAGGKGAGLGLAIVRRLCELYDWRVSLAPRPQGGAVATLDFRLRA